MIYLQNLYKQFGPKIILKNVNFHLRPGERVGLVGENGTGKTTLFRIIMKTESSDSGKIVFRKGAQAATLEQELNAYNGSVLERVISGDHSLQVIRRKMDDLEKQMTSDPISEVAISHYGKLQHQFEQLNGYELEPRACAILSGLGFSNDKFKKPLNEFSGGWRMRVEMARLLLQNPDILLLDEPTNHFDLKSVEWLEGFLKNYNGSLLLISHDRRFLNNLVTKIVELDRGVLTTYSGNYNDFERLKKERAAQLLSESVNQQKRINEIERFIERFRAKNTKATQVQSRIKMLNKMERIETMTDTKTVGFRFPQPVRTGRISMELEKIDKSYGDNIVYQNFSIRIERGWKVALVGENGAGKSTVIKLLTTLMPPTKGKLSVLGINAAKSPLEIRKKIGVVLQQPSYEMTLSVENSLDKYGMMWDVDKTTRKQRTEELLTSFGLQDIRKKKNDDLSIGQRRRVQVAREFMHDMELLFLDEPTVGLDPSARRKLLDFLRDQVKKSGLTIFYTTHVLSEAEYLCDNIAIINNGKIMAVDSPSELKNRFGHEKTIKINITKTSSSLSDLLSDIPDCKIELEPEPIITINSSNSEVVLMNILKILNQNNITINDLSAIPTNLEEIFLKVVSDSNEPDN